MDHAKTSAKLAQIVSSAMPASALNSRLLNAPVKLDRSEARRSLTGAVP
jgi:hypothetical protein